MKIAKRKAHLSAFGLKDNPVSVVSLIGLFLFGLYLSILLHSLLSIAYAGLWVASYLVLYYGTCRYCAYYGKSCPVPLEGSLVDRVVSKSDKPFGWMAIFYASLAYVLRIGIPVAALVEHQLVTEGVIFASLFVLFWTSHLCFTGCPNCINYGCPMNPGPGH